MPKLPKIAIVGRPNVGKSALFNRICRKRIAIVDEMEGVTRDRLYAEAECFGRNFELIDTGGIDPASNAPFNEQIRRQALIAIEEADALILVVDSQVGATALDEEVASILLKTQKPLCLAINKIDHVDQKHLMHEFYGLGISKMICTSAQHGYQIAELLEALLTALPKETEEVEDNGFPKLAIVGRPNVGKSTLINTLLNDERCIVSPIAGTTRDAIDLPIEIDGKSYTLIDTAGVRKKTTEKEVVDKFAFIRTERAIERADLCVLMLDSQEGMTRRDKRIANAIEAAGKGCLLAFNKWDLVKKTRMEHCLRAIEEDSPFLRHCPKLFISASTGRNLDKIFPTAETMLEEGKKRISTGVLNRFIAATLQKTHPPMIRGKRLRIYYMTQVDNFPPRFLLFVNHPNLMTEAYRKFILNQFRKEFVFEGMPIVMHLRGKERKEKEAHPVAIGDQEWTPDLSDVLAANSLVEEEPTAATALQADHE